MFERHTMIAAALGALAIATFGDRPIVAAVNSSPTVSIRRNPVFVGPVWPGDFNGDGIIDLAGSTMDPALPDDPAFVTVALGKGDGTFGPPLRSEYMGTVFDVGDFNNDGKLDVLAQRVDVDEDLIAIAGKGDGTFGAADIVVNTFRLHFARSADLDGDGNRDAIVVETAETSGGDSDIIWIIRGHGDLTFDTFGATVIPASAGAIDATVTDLNVDGLKDIVVANHSAQSLTVLRNQGSLAFAATEIALPHYANDVAAADVNGDGWPDLIVAASDSGLGGNGFHQGFASVLLGTGGGAIAGPIDYPTAPGARGIVVGDFTRDGILDIATANLSSIKVSDCGWPWKTWDSLSILPGNGNGTYAAASNFSIGSQLRVDDQETNRNRVWSLATADVNGDRAADLIVSDGTIFLNQPTDPNWPPTVTASSTPPAADDSTTLMAIADEVDQDMLTYSWIDSGGTPIPPVPNPCFTPSTLGVHTFTVTVNDGHGHTASSSVTVDFGGDGGGGSTAPIMTITAPTAGATLAAGTPYQIKFHIDDPSMALYEWTIDYSLDNGATWGHIWECHNAGQPSQPGVPTSRDDSCTWRNPGPPSTQAILVIYAQDDADSSIGTPSSVRVTIAAAEGAVPDPWQHQDIGAVGAAGTATASDATTFTVRGSGADIWGTADEFHFVYRRWYSTLSDAPFEYTARVDSVENVNAWTKAGLMVRGGLGASAPHAMVVVSPSKGIAFQRRTAAGGVTVSTAGPLISAPVWLKLAVQGTTVTAYYRKNLTDLWTVVGRQEFPDFGDAAAGLVVSSHADGTRATATFSNVDVRDIPAWTSADIDTTGGSTTSDGVMTSVTGKGADIWGTSDQFRYAYTRRPVEVSLTARVRSVQNVNVWTKAGIMLREVFGFDGAPEANARYVVLMVTPGKGVALQYRSTAGGAAASAGTTTGIAPGWIRLTRSGDTYTGSWSKDGVTWSTVGSVSMPSNPSHLWCAGLAVTSHSAAAATASFDDVRFDDGHPFM